MTSLSQRISTLRNTKLRDDLEDNSNTSRSSNESEESEDLNNRNKNFDIRNILNSAGANKRNQKTAQSIEKRIEPNSKVNNEETNNLISNNQGSAEKTRELSYPRIGKKDEKGKAAPIFSNLLSNQSPTAPEKRRLDSFSFDAKANKEHNRVESGNVENVIEQAGLLEEQTPQKDDNNFQGSNYPPVELEPRITEEREYTEETEKEVATFANNNQEEVSKRTGSRKTDSNSGLPKQNPSGPQSKKSSVQNDTKKEEIKEVKKLVANTKSTVEKNLNQIPKKEKQVKNTQAEPEEPKQTPKAANKASKIENTNSNVPAKASPKKPVQEKKSLLLARESERSNNPTFDQGRPNTTQESKSEKDKSNAPSQTPKSSESSRVYKSIKPSTPNENDSSNSFINIYNKGTKKNSMDIKADQKTRDSVQFKVVPNPTVSTANESPKKRQTIRTEPRLTTQENEKQYIIKRHKINFRSVRKEENSTILNSKPDERSRMTIKKEDNSTLVTRPEDRSRRTTKKDDITVPTKTEERSRLIDETSPRRSTSRGKNSIFKSPLNESKLTQSPSAKGETGLKYKEMIATKKLTILGQIENIEKQLAEAEADLKAEEDKGKRRESKAPTKVLNKSTSEKSLGPKERRHIKDEIKREKMSFVDSRKNDASSVTSESKRSNSRRIETPDISPSNGRMSQFGIQRKKRQSEVLSVSFKDQEKRLSSKDSFEARNKEWLVKRRDRLASYERERYMEETKGCTFQPSVRSPSASQRIENNSFYQRNVEWLERKKEALDHKTQELYNKIMAKDPSRSRPASVVSSPSHIFLPRQPSIDKEKNFSFTGQIDTKIQKINNDNEKKLREKIERKEIEVANVLKREFSPDQASVERYWSNESFDSRKKSPVFKKKAEDPQPPKSEERLDTVRKILNLQNKPDPKSPEPEKEQEIEDIVIPKKPEKENIEVLSPQSQNKINKDTVKYLEIRNNRYVWVTPEETTSKEL